jgi:pimeloyl-ACP methyl ester carboxylesterase
MIKDYAEQIFQIKNIRGHKVHCVYNYNDENNPTIVIPSQYEKTIRNNLISAIYLLNNGYNVVRYDNTFHRGNSEGDIIDFSLQNVYDDLVAVINFIKVNSMINTTSGIGLLGTSILSRVAFRYLANYSQEVNVFLSLVGVTNLQHTLKVITGIDTVKELQENPNTIFGTRKVLKYEVNWDNFLDGILHDNYYSLESTKSDIEKMTVPTYLIVAEKDRWAPMEFYEKAFSSNTKILQGAYKIPKAEHELYKNPQAAEYAMQAIVKVFNDFWKRDGFQSGLLVKPNTAEIISLNRREREREFKHA